MNINPINVKQYLGYMIGAAKEYCDEHVNSIKGEYAKSMGDKMQEDTEEALKWLAQFSKKEIKGIVDDAFKKMKTEGLDNDGVFFENNPDIQKYEWDAFMDSETAQMTLQIEILSHAEKILKIIKEQTNEKTSVILSNVDKLCNAIEVEIPYWNELGKNLTADELKLLRFALRSISFEQTHNKLRKAGFPEKMLTEVFNSHISETIDLTDFIIKLAGKESDSLAQ